MNQPMIYPGSKSVKTESAGKKQVAHLVHINFLLAPDAAIPTDLASGASGIQLLALYYSRFDGH